MPYLGNVPAENYAQVSYQDLTGGSGTSFTLDYPVGSAGEIEVFVNNVRQEPTVAYTVNGTALTMTGSVAATDDFYIVFQGKAEKSGTIPEKQSDGTYVFPDDVTVSGNITSTGIDDNATSTAMTLDSSNNLLVGQTSASNSVNGTYIRTGDRSGFNNTNGSCVSFNRLSSDGDIVEFRKDGSIVGSIGTVSSTPYFADSLGRGHRIYVDGVTRFAPTLGGSSYDASIDLGQGTNRWRDLYLSGGVYIGGPTSGNLLDDYEEGTWTPVLRFGSASTGMSYFSQSGTYTKIGDTVSIRSYINLSNKGTATGNADITGLPFSVATSTSNYAAVSLHLNGVSFSGFPNSWFGVGSSTMQIGTTTDAGSFSSLTHANFNTNSGFILSGVYKTNQ